MPGTGYGNPVGKQLRFNTAQGPGGITPQVAAYQQILNLLPVIGGSQLLSLRQVLHYAHGHPPDNFGGNVSQPCRIGNPSTPEVSKWTSCKTEVLDWQKYLGELTAWAMQASLELGSEIEHGPHRSLGVK